MGGRGGRGDDGLLKVRDEREALGKSRKSVKVSREAEGGREQRPAELGEGEQGTLEEGAGRWTVASGGWRGWLKGWGMWRGRNGRGDDELLEAHGDGAALGETRNRRRSVAL